MNEKDEQAELAALLRRAQDLADRCDRAGVPTSTTFLTPAQRCALAQWSPRHSVVQPVFSGGYPDAERQVAFFLPDWMDEPPIEETLRAVQIKPGFGTPGHRDYLGAILGLGVSRPWLGDVLVTEDESLCPLPAVRCRDAAGPADPGGADGRPASVCAAGLCPCAGATAEGGDLYRPEPAAGCGDGGAVPSFPHPGGRAHPRWAGAAQLHALPAARRPRRAGGYPIPARRWKGQPPGSRRQLPQRQDISQRRPLAVTKHRTSQRSRKRRSFARLPSAPAVDLGDSQRLP